MILALRDGESWRAPSGLPPPAPRVLGESWLLVFRCGAVGVGWSIPVGTVGGEAL